MDIWEQPKVVVQGKQLLRRKIKEWANELCPGFIALSIISSDYKYF